MHVPHVHYATEQLLIITNWPNKGFVNDDNRLKVLTNKVAILDIYKAHLSKHSWILDILIFMYNSAKTLRSWF